VKADEKNRQAHIAELNQKESIRNELRRKAEVENQRK